MLTLDSLKQSTESVFENKNKVPEPSIMWKDKIEALEAANLDSHHSSCIFAMRTWQAAEMGFKHVESSELVEMLMGEPHTESFDAKDSQYYEWTYNHHTDQPLGKNWGGTPIIFNRIEKKGLWHSPPFAKVKKWSCQFGKLNYLKRDIPYGVVLRINECKEFKLFNCFNVLAPMEAWERKTDIDPIVVATIWELPRIDGEYRTAGQVAHYFLAQW